MKKFIIIAFLIVAVIVAFILLKPGKSENEEANKENKQENIQEAESKLGTINSAEDLSNLVEKIYEGQETLPSVQTQIIDVTDTETVQYLTGLANPGDVEYLVVSEPMMSSQAYSLILLKVKEGINIEKMAKGMNENIDNRKWICVTAEKVYTTSSGDVICLVMSSEEMAKPIYEKFKLLAGTIGEEYERTAEEIELPEDMY